MQGEGLTETVTRTRPGVLRRAVRPEHRKLLCKTFEKAVKLGNQLRLQQSDLLHYVLNCIFEDAREWRVDGGFPTPEERQAALQQIPADPLSLYRYCRLSVSGGGHRAAVPAIDAAARRYAAISNHEGARTLRRPGYLRSVCLESINGIYETKCIERPGSLQYGICFLP